MRVSNPEDTFTERNIKTQRKEAKEKINAEAEKRIHKNHLDNCFTEKQWYI